MRLGWLFVALGTFVTGTASAMPPAPPVAHPVRVTPPPVVQHEVRPPEVHPIQLTQRPNELHLAPIRTTAKPHAQPAIDLPAPQLYTGVRPLLDGLKERHIAFGVASNNRKDVVVGLASKLGLGDLLTPDNIVAANFGRTYPSKPSPKILEVLAEQQGTDPKSTIYFGDKPDDVRAARAAGMIAVGISHGDAATEKKFQEIGASLVITKINEQNLQPVLQFVEKVGAKAVYFDWDDTLATNPSRSNRGAHRADETSFVFWARDRFAA